MSDDFSEEGDNMTTAEANSGGRVRYDLGSEVRYVTIEGAISPIYLVDQERSDRKGHISLKEKNGTRIVRVHYRRLLPVMIDRAVVIESQDRQWALCPDDGSPVEVSSGDDSMTCPKCSKSFSLFWMGVKPMAEAKTKDETKPKAERAPKAAKAEKPAPAKAPKPERAPKAPRETREPIKVDLVAIAKTANCELWSKNVQFDHERISAQAHVLIFVGENPRKYCFNTYNDTLGKKAGPLLIDQFVANELPDGKKAPWFAAADLDKVRIRLQKDGYEQAKA